MPVPTRDRDPLWDIDAVAQRLGVQPRHVRRLVKSLLSNPASGSRDLVAGWSCWLGAGQERPER